MNAFFDTRQATIATIIAVISVIANVIFWFLARNEKKQDKLEALRQENAALKEENKNLKDLRDIDDKLIPHENATYLTLEKNGVKIDYCAVCWGSNRKLIPIVKNFNTGYFSCGCGCGNKGIFDRRIVESNKRDSLARSEEIQKFVNYKG